MQISKETVDKVREIIKERKHFKREKDGLMVKEIFIPHRIEGIRCPRICENIIIWYLENYPKPQVIVVRDCTTVFEGPHIETEDFVLLWDQTILEDRFLAMV